MFSDHTHCQDHYNHRRTDHHDRQRIASAIDSSGVESLWIAGYTVDWETGRSLTGHHVTDGQAHTHCSAFVAAIAMRLDIYILRPPQHGTVLLANAQGAWLDGAGAAWGWRPLFDEQQAQEAANNGEFVVASYINPDAEKSGHIAIVRPGHGEIEIAQAGNRNFTRGLLEEGFGSRRWSIRFYGYIL